MGELHDRMPVTLDDADWAEVVGRGAGDRGRAVGDA